jgi:hypothetical protein
MQAQQRETRKNYIGILSDQLEDRHAADSLAESGRRMKDYLLGLVAAVLNRHGDAG